MSYQPDLGLSTALILAGGLGTRLREVVPDVPKPMALVNGRPFLEFQFDYWIAHGVQRFILSVGYRWETIKKHFGPSYKGALLEYAVEDIPLGTGGGLLKALQMAKVDETLLVLNGDTFFDVSLPYLLSEHRRTSSDWTFALFQTSNRERYMGVDLSDDGVVTALRSFESLDFFLANGGVYLVEPSAVLAAGFSHNRKISLEDELLPALQAKGKRLLGVRSDGCFIDIGVPSDYFRAPEVIASYCWG